MTDLTPAAAPEPAARSARWRFAGCVFDGRSLELTVDGALVALEPKPLEMLMFLLRHPGEVVTKEELQDNLWPGRILSESVLTKCMAKLRQALGDEDQAVIKTVHGFGYRLLAPVVVESPEPAARVPVVGLAAGDSPPLRPHWFLKAPLGSGGHGEVWLAEHAKTHERRVFKFGRDAASLTSLKREITLFRLLQDTLGVERRDFVRLLDWNLEEPPYFVEAECAAGGSLPQWAESQGGLASVPLDLRLELVAQAADALAAAHSAGVLHKDLKPSNILVDLDEARGPRAKLGDFGSGRVMDLARLEHLEITRLGFTRTTGDADTTSGTPFYYAPELLGGQQPTVQSDIYALGVILYQAVVADFTRPLAPGWEQDVADELLREDIAAAAAGRAENRLADAAELARRLRALAPRRSERAAERRAQSEAAELRRALERARVRRSWAFATAGVFALALLVAGVLLVQLRAARDAAQRAGSQAQAVNDFLVNDLLKRANPYASGRREVSAHDLLDGAARQVGARFASRPEVEAAVRLVLGESFHGLAEYAKGEEHLRRAIELGHEPVAGQARLALGRLLTMADRPGEVAAVTAPLATHPDARLRLGGAVVAAWADHDLGKLDASLRQLDVLLPQVREVFGDRDAYTSTVLRTRAKVLMHLGKNEEALAGYQEALDIARKLHGEHDVDTLEAYRALGTGYWMVNRHDDALPPLREAHRIAMEVLGAEHETTLQSAVDLANAHSGRDDYAEAERLLLGALAVREQREDKSDEMRTLLNNLGKLYGDMGDDARALPLLERAWREEAAASGEAHPDTLLWGHNVAFTLGLLGRHAEAESIQRRNLELAPGVYGAQHWYLGLMRYSLANSLARLGRNDEAEQHFAEAIALLEKQLGAGSEWTKKAVRFRDEARALRAGAKKA